MRDQTAVVAFVFALGVTEPLQIFWLNHKAELNVGCTVEPDAVFHFPMLR